MKVLFDAHTHSISSGHCTTDTVTDLARKGKETGLEYLGVTDHFYGKLTSVRLGYFTSLKLVSPKKIYGVNMLYGAEVNILDRHGKIDMPDETMAKLDYCIASLHSNVTKPMDIIANTHALVNAMQNKYVNILGHADCKEFIVDFKLLAKEAKATNTMIELNAVSVDPQGYRGNSTHLVKDMLKACKNEGVYIVLGSDSHGRQTVGEFENCLKLLDEIGYPTQLIVNYDMQLFTQIVNNKRNG